MSVRSIVAFLLLANYLLIAGMGGIVQPYEQTSLVLIQTNYAGQPYQECRYVRMDGLEDFLIESLRLREQKEPRPLGHSILVEVNGVDLHCLFYSIGQESAAVSYLFASFTSYYCSSYLSDGVYGMVSPPPWMA